MSGMFDGPPAPVDRSGLHAINRLPMSSLHREPQIDLDGEWQFQLRQSDAAAELDDWATVVVPSLWTMSSDTDRPHYTNVPMPFDEVYPALPERNPMGVYRRRVQVQPVDGRRTIIHVGAAEGYLRVAVNGTPVGTSGDSHLAAEFDITDAVVAGMNTIELAVTKWSAASYVEDQDQWWQSGIARSVFLYTRPEISLADVSIVADYNAKESTGSLKAIISTEGLRHRREIGHSVRVHVLGEVHDLPIAPRMSAPTLPKPTKDRSAPSPSRLPEDFMDLLSITAAAGAIPPEFRAIPDLFGGYQGSNMLAGSAILDLADLTVSPWSAERPNLENVTVELVDERGCVVDATRFRIGFRRVNIEGRDLLVNGERILIQGVNRHDVDPTTGRVMTRERLLAELSLLKRCNVNAIRTSHYPNDPYFLDLCDELGFYVVDEADVESHAFASTLADDPRYLSEIVDRVARMVLRDRNRACVIAWSLGNESGYAAAHDAAAAWLRRFDSTRPVQYEGAIGGDWYSGRLATDIVTPMYASFASLEAYSADPRGDRPLILCEYAYSQGNSTGGLAEYWKLFETLPGLQGGFIWEFTDHALDPDGDGHSRYGGDFGDEPNNGPTLLNGVAFADLTPKPALLEARGVFSPVRIVSGVDAARTGRIRLRNRRTFADLSDLVFEVHVQTRSGAGAPIRIATPQLAPGQELTIELPVEVTAALADPDALALTLSVLTREDRRWAPARTLIVVHQIVLPRSVPALPSGGSTAMLDEAGNVPHPLLARAPRLALWRALTDNDRSSSLDQRFVRSGFFTLELVDSDVAERDGATTVDLTYRAAFGATVRHRRTVRRLADGDHVFTEEVELPTDTRDGLRVGLEFELVEGFEDAAWVGLGPWENYPDRRASALLGRWESSIDDLAVPYVRPQENGTRGSVTELELTGPAGRAEVWADVPVHINVARHTVDQLEAVDHWWEIPASNATVVHIDVAHRGIGTALLGPDTRPEHRLFGSRYAWSWRLRLEASN